MSNEIIKPTRSNNNIVAPINIYIVYEITKKRISSFPTLENCLFGAVKSTKDPDIDKYTYSGYGIGFERRGEFSFGDGFGQNVIIFGADMSSSAHSNNKTKSILVLGERFTQELDNTKISAEKIHSINFTENNKKLGLRLHYNGSNSYLFVNGKQVIKFKTKDPEIIGSPICLGNISKEFSIDNMKKIGLNRYAYGFSVDYDAVAIENILDIHKYLMENNNIKWCLNLFKNVFLEQ